jgi:hypothetical protein
VVLVGVWHGCRSVSGGGGACVGVGGGWGVGSGSWCRSSGLDHWRRLGVGREWDCGSRSGARVMGFRWVVGWGVGDLGGLGGPKHVDG